jgi:hypothetical protein
VIVAALGNKPALHRAPPEDCYVAHLGLGCQCKLGPSVVLIISKTPPTSTILASDLSRSVSTKIVRTADSQEFRLGLRYPLSSAFPSLIRSRRSGLRWPITQVVSDEAITTERQSVNVIYAAPGFGYRRYADCCCSVTTGPRLGRGSASRLSGSSWYLSLSCTLSELWVADHKITVVSFWSSLCCLAECHLQKLWHQSGPWASY